MRPGDRYRRSVEHADSAIAPAPSPACWLADGPPEARAALASLRGPTRTHERHWHDHAAASKTHSLPERTPARHLTPRQQLLQKAWLRCLRSADHLPGPCFECARSRMHPSGRRRGTGASDAVPRPALRADDHAWRHRSAMLPHAYTLPRDGHEAGTSPFGIRPGAAHVPITCGATLLLYTAPPPPGRPVSGCAAPPCMPPERHPVGRAARPGCDPYPTMHGAPCAAGQSACTAARACRRR